MALLPGHRRQEQEVGEAEVGQHPPGGGQSLEMGGVVGRQPGVGASQLREHRHGVRRSGGRAAPFEAAQLGAAGVAQQRAESVGAVGHEGQLMGVRRGGERHPGGLEAGQEAGGRVLLGSRLAPAGARHLGGDAVLGGSLGEPVPPGGELTGRHDARHLGEIRVGEDVGGPGGGELLDGGDIPIPHHLDVSALPLLVDDGVAHLVEAPGPEPVHRAEQQIEGPPGKELGHVAHAPRVVVDLESEPDGDRGAIGGRAQHGADVLLEVTGGVLRPVGGGLGPEQAVGIGVPPSGQEPVCLPEPEKVFRDADLLDTAGCGRFGVGAYRFDPIGPIFAVTEQVEVVIEHFNVMVMD